MDSLLRRHSPDPRQAPCKGTWKASTLLGVVVRGRHSCRSELPRCGTLKDYISHSARRLGREPTPPGLPTRPCAGAARLGLTGRRCFVGGGRDGSPWHCELQELVKIKFAITNRPSRCLSRRDRANWGILSLTVALLLPLGRRCSLFVWCS